MRVARAGAARMDWEDDGMTDAPLVEMIKARRPCYLSARRVERNGPTMT